MDPDDVPFTYAELRAQTLNIPCISVYQKMCAVFAGKNQRQLILDEMLAHENPDQLYTWSGSWRQEEVWGPHMKDVYFVRPLSYAVWTHENEYVKKLIEKGASPTSHFYFKLRLIDYGSTSCLKKIPESILRSPFYDALRAGNDYAIRLFASMGVCLNGVAPTFRFNMNPLLSLPSTAPALAIALQHDQKKVLVTLLEYGADIQIQSFCITWLEAETSIAQFAMFIRQKELLDRAISYARMRLIRLLCHKVQPADPEKPFVPLNRDVAQYIASYCYGYNAF